MRKMTLLAAGTLVAFACAGGDRAPESQDEEPEGTVAIVVPDSPPTTTDAGVVTAAPAVGLGDTLVTGIVRETGAVPLTQLVIQPIGSGVPPVAIRGAFKDEIQNLIGAEVRAWGPPVDNQPPVPPRAVDVSGYEIVSIGGETPFVGTLVEDGAAFFLVSGDTLDLGSIPEALRAHVGSTIWVVGPRQGDALSVQSYGVIRN